MNLTLAITGASGAILAREALRALEADKRVARVHFVASENSLRVLAEELGVSGRTNLLKKLLGAAPAKTIQHADSDIGAPIASGSHPSDGMIVLPCSMGTLATIALGLANSLIARAADVTLKERRTLILCVRETPFNRIHLRNMTWPPRPARRSFLACLPSTITQSARRNGSPIRLSRPRPHRSAPARSLCLEGGRVENSKQDQLTLPRQGSVASGLAVVGRFERGFPQGLKPAFKQRTLRHG